MSRRIGVCPIGDGKAEVVRIGSPVIVVSTGDTDLCCGTGRALARNIAIADEDSIAVERFATEDAATAAARRRARLDREAEWLMAMFG